MKKEMQLDFAKPHDQITYIFTKLLKVEYFRRLMMLATWSLKSSLMGM